MKKFFSLVLALVMALSLTTVAWGAPDTTWPTGTTVDGVTTVELTNDVELSAPVTIAADTIINGNGHTLTYTGTDRAITVESSAAGVDLTINNLTIVAASAQRGINYNTTGKLTLYKVTVSGDANSPTYAVNLPSSSDGAIVDINECSLSGNIALNIWGEDMTITVTNSALTSVDNTDAEDYAAVVLNNDGTNVAAGTVVTFSGGSITAEDENGDPSFAVQLSTSDAVVDTGDAAVTGEIAVAVALIAYPNNQFYAFFSMADANEYAEEKGAPAIEVLETAFESGESFEKLDGVQYNLPAGMELADDGTGNVIVAPAGTTAGGVGTKFYVADDAAADDWKLLASFPGDDLSDFAKDSSDNFLPCYEVPNYGFFTEVKAANGAYKLTYGAAKVVYLAPVDYSDVHYDYKATALKVVDEDDAECGDWFVTGLDEDDKYYAAYTKKGEVEGVFVAEKNGSMQILVGGKIVDVEWQDIGTDVEWKLHQFKGYDVVNGEYTTVKCENCPKVAKLYANATAATIGKKEPVKLPNNLGWVTLADFFDFGAVAGGSVSIAPDTKVESAETFDAGIAMYVAMSVMAAAGSAVVIGKKKD